MGPTKSPAAGRLVTGRRSVPGRRCAAPVKQMMGLGVFPRGDAIVAPLCRWQRHRRPCRRRVSDPKMQQAILPRRWLECVSCVQAKAPLAATVMMGGLLETVLLARVHQAANKAPIFSAAAAPKEGTTGKTKPLGEWALKNYIDVAHELKWITVSVKSVSEVLRELPKLHSPAQRVVARCYAATGGCGPPQAGT